MATRTYLHQKTKGTIQRLDHLTFTIAERESGMRNEQKSDTIHTKTGTEMIMIVRTQMWSFGQHERARALRF